MKEQKLEPVDRAVLKAAANIIGPSSAAQQALDDAARHNGPMRFWKSGNTIIVQKISVDSSPNESIKSVSK